MLSDCFAAFFGAAGAFKSEQRLTEGTVAPAENNAPQQAPKYTGKQARMLILAMDYEGTAHPLTCTKDGRNILDLARRCGVEDITVLENNMAHFENVERNMRDILSRCEPGDFFIFNYSGHGVGVPDEDGDEEDGKDEALALVTPDGKLDFSQFMTDDQFREIITGELQQRQLEDVNVLILCDCCHSGTIGDFDFRGWDNIKAVSLSGCQDAQTSGDTGKGGIFTHSLLMAIEHMQQHEKEDYSVAELYNAQLMKDDTVFNSEQVITMKWSRGCEKGATSMAWPLLPLDAYSAPWQG